MSAEGMEGLLPAYVSGELSDEDEARVEAALEESPILRDEVSRYEKLLVLLTAAAAEEIQAPASLEGRIARQVVMRSYLVATTRLVEGLIGNYRRAIVYYLGLS